MEKYLNTIQLNWIILSVFINIIKNNVKYIIHNFLMFCYLRAIMEDFEGDII